MYIFNSNGLVHSSNTELCPTLSLYFFNSLCKVCFFMYGLYFINSILCELFLRFFCVMYRLIPCTPASLCSVHSNVTCNRTSFFFEAAMTCKEPREEDVDVLVVEENAEVETREDKMVWGSAFISVAARERTSHGQSFRAPSHEEKP